MVRGCQEGKKDNASDRHISPHEEPVFLSLMAGLTNSRVGTTGRRGWLTFSLSLSFSVPQVYSGGPLLCAGMAQGIVSYR